MLVEWLIDWLTDWLFDWLTVWLSDWLSGCVSVWPTDWLNDWLTDWLTDWPTVWYTDRLTDWLTDWSNSSQTKRYGELNQPPPPAWQTTTASSNDSLEKHPCDKYIRPQILIWTYLTPKYPYKTSPGAQSLSSVLNCVNPKRNQLRTRFSTMKKQKISHRKFRPTQNIISRFLTLIPE